jgi:poly-gamma-glutamate synthesis protein (capsule biosynthesis protein)
MNPRNIEVLSRARIDFCALANNHVQDWGQEGMADTIDTLRGVGIACAGAGTNRRRAAAPAILNVPCKGRVVVVSLATPCSWTPLDWAAMPDRPGVNLIDITEQSFRLLRRQLVGLRRPGDIVVVSIHWGDNFGYEIDRRHRVFAWRLIDEAKVDLVHGHSSHHVRGIEVHGGKPILYGCGDLINDYEGSPRPPGREAFLPDLGLIYLARFSTADGRFLGLQMRPTRLRRMRVQHAGDQDRRQLCDVLNREGEKFGTRVVEEDGLLSLQVGGAR